MRNLLLTVAYDGTRYRGWQRLGNTDNTIQGKLEGVLSRLENRPVEISGCSRTDAGVHARAQQATVRLEANPDQVLAYCNRYLPEDIGILSVQEVPPRFHARLAPSRKTYCYRLWNSPEPCIFERKYCYCPSKTPDWDKIEEALPFFRGTHDFSAFCTRKSKDKSAVRTIYSITMEKTPKEVRLYFTGDGFLYNMVRILVGTLLEVGWGERTLTDFPLERQQAGFTAPPQGLCLMEISYEHSDFRHE